MLRRPRRGRRVHAHALTREPTQLRLIELPAQRRAVSARRIVWTVLTAVCAIFLAFALTHRHHAAATQPHPIYGIELSDTSGFGPDAVCTEYERQSDANWRCAVAATNSGHAPVKPAVGYVGECNHLKIDVDAWVCLGDDPALPQAPKRPDANA